MGESRILDRKGEKRRRKEKSLSKVKATKIWKVGTRATWLLLLLRKEGLISEERVLSHTWSTKLQKINPLSQECKNKNAELTCCIQLLGVDI